MNSYKVEAYKSIGDIGRFSFYILAESIDGALIEARKVTKYEIMSINYIHGHKNKEASQ